MPRHHWTELPARVRHAVTARTGPVSGMEHIAAGSNADLTITLTTSAGQVFCKGATVGTNRADFLRNEVRLNPFLPRDLVPRLLWSIDTNGWLITGFEHAPGRVADLRPGSPDLPLIAATLTRMATAFTPCPSVDVQPATARWGQLLDPALVDGDTLLHTDMTHNNFLVTDDRVQVVDWSMPCRGAAWLDTARMLIRLIRAGHTPEQAEAWAARLPMWAATTPPAVDAFAAAVTTVSRRLRDRSSTTWPHLVEMADAGDAWLQHRRVALR